jgi:hypothetical protein
MPSSTASDLQKSIKSIASNAQKSLDTSPKKLRSLLSSDGSMKRDLSIRIQKMKSTSKFVVGPVKRGSGTSGASSALEKNPSTETEESKKSADETGIHRGFYA